MKAAQAIFLIGFMGSGKSAVGLALADRMAREFIDLDALIVKNAGRAIAEIFAQDGEAYFRELEFETLRSLRQNEAIVALGGGAFIAERNRAIIESRGISIWLDCALDAILARLGEDKSRPLYRNPEQMAQLLAARAPIYALADLRIDVTNLSVNEIVDRLMARLPN
jgi:shikimate kinase